MTWEVLKRELKTLVTGLVMIAIVFLLFALLENTVVSLIKDYKHFLT